jgi:membrane protease YdiL (CAAX protease family)
MVTGQLQHLRTDSFHGGVYAETFAVWLILFFVLQLIMHMLSEEGISVFPSAAAMLLSLLALAWPCLRGIPWHQVCEDIGWTRGRNPALESAVGVCGYAMSLSPAAIGLIIYVILVRLTSPVEADPTKSPTGPSHPVVHPLLDQDSWQRIQIFILASVIAPIVEETIFRGVLYRHLREASRGLGFVLSVVVSGLVVSFVFAVIHPQGLIAVPPLMGLAFGFALVREWRGSLIPSMVAHGLNNAIVLMFIVLFVGD